MVRSRPAGRLVIEPATRDRAQTTDSRIPRLVGQTITTSTLVVGPLRRIPPMSPMCNSLPGRPFDTEIDAVSSAPTTVTELDSAHSPFLSQPAALAEAIAAASGLDRAR